MPKPLAIDLFCGSLRWSAGWLELGGRVVGFDIEHLPHHGPVPDGAELVLQDVRTLSGAQFKDASLIVASPPCPEFSFMSMPWRRSKQIAAALRGEGEFPAGYRGSRTIAELTALFDCCFRLQREAAEAAGHHIPLVVENVKGAQPWIGRARGKFGSYFLWGDVLALMPSTLRIKRPGRNFHAFENRLGSSQAFNGAEHETRGVKVPGLRHGTFPGGSLAQGALDGVKTVGHVNKRDGYSHTRHLTNQAESDAIKQHGSGAAWFDKALDERRRTNSRRAASAMIARIPLELSRHIARCYWPEDLP